MTSSLSTSFFDAAATFTEKNEKIASILPASKALDASKRLKSLVSSIQLSDEYRSYVVDATCKGVKDYLNGLGKNVLRSSMDQFDGQALHECILGHTAEINEVLLNTPRDAIPRAATIVSFYDPNSMLLGYHKTSQNPLSYEIGINTGHVRSHREAVSIVAHETAHHIEDKLALLHQWLPEAIPVQFKMDASYFGSLKVYRAYISSEKTGAHDLYSIQANERLAREAEEAAIKTMDEHRL